MLDERGDALQCLGRGPVGKWVARQIGAHQAEDTQGPDPMFLGRRAKKSPPHAPAIAVAVADSWHGDEGGVEAGEAGDVGEALVALGTFTEFVSMSGDDALAGLPLPSVGAVLVRALHALAAEGPFQLPRRLLVLPEVMVRPDGQHVLKVRPAPDNMPVLAAELLMLHHDARLPG